MKGNRIVIPVSMRLDVLDKLHDAHQGIGKCSMVGSPCFKTSIFRRSISSNISLLFVSTARPS